MEQAVHEGSLFRCELCCTLVTCRFCADTCRVSHSGGSFFRREYFQKGRNSLRSIFFQTGGSSCFAAVTIQGDSGCCFSSAVFLYFGNSCFIDRFRIRCICYTDAFIVCIFGLPQLPAAGSIAENTVQSGLAEPGNTLGCQRYGRCLIAEYLYGFLHLFLIFRFFGSLHGFFNKSVILL